MAQAQSLVEKLRSLYAMQYSQKIKWSMLRAELVEVKMAQGGTQMNLPGPRCLDQAPSGLGSGGRSAQLSHANRSVGDHG